MQAGDAFASMCVGNGNGVTDALIERCLLSACCMRAWHSEPTPLVYIIDAALPRAARNFLSRVTNASFVVSTGPPSWPPAPSWPSASSSPPARLYTFTKLRAWRLDYSRLLWYDSDAYFGADPAHYFEKYGGAARLAAAHFPMDAAGDKHLNSGIMVLRPSSAEHARLDRLWRDGSFARNKSWDALTEQDLLIEAYDGDFDRMDLCDNYRGRHRPYHRSCPQPHRVIHSISSHYMAEARERLMRAPWRNRCVPELGNAIALARSQARRMRNSAAKSFSTFSSLESRPGTFSY